MANVKVVLNEGLRAEMEVRGLRFYADEPTEDGGTNTAPKPTELLLGALGACAAVTARLYAQRKGWNLERVEVEVSHGRVPTADYPGYDPDKHGAGDTLNEFRQRIIFKGDLDDQQRARLLEIAGRCPVHRMLTDPKALIEELIAEEQGERA
jgi:putative redox protein